jgi:adenine phosphoribosyltransferase
MNRAEKATLQLRACAFLGMLKRSRTYDELASETGIPAGDLNRYVNGHVLPGVERAERILGELAPPVLEAELRRRIAIDPEGYVDNSGVVYDREFLELVAPVAAMTIGTSDPDVVLTAATDGITIACAMAAYLGAEVVYAKQTRETAVDAFIESRQRLQSGIELTYYLPAAAIGEGASVLIVDDLIRSGETQTVLLDIAEQAAAAVVGMYALIAVGDDGLAETRARTSAPVQALCHLPARSEP